MRRIAERFRDRAVFIGGVAVEAYAPYRRTHDIDVVVRERDFPALKACLVEAGFAHRRTHLAKHTFKGREGGEVDAYTERVGEVPVEEALFRRARSLPYAASPCPSRPSRISSGSRSWRVGRWTSRTSPCSSTRGGKRWMRPSRKR